MELAIMEYVSSAGVKLKIDQKQNVIRGVKVLGLSSKNGRRYEEEALRGAIALYEGAKVNVNHPQGSPTSPRDYRDRLGVIKGVYFRKGKGLFADLHFNPKHGIAEQLMWDAKNVPENVGFSHNVLARTKRSSKGILVAEITRVHSVDLVADPATTQGLFEQQEKGFENKTEKETGNKRSSEELKTLVEQGFRWQDLSRECLIEQRPDLVMEIQEDFSNEQYRKLKQDLLESQERSKEALKKVKVYELLVEHGLPLPKDGDETTQQLTSRVFLEELFEAKDEKRLVELVKDRAMLMQQMQEQAGQVVIQTPVSKNLTMLEQRASCKQNENRAEEFAKAIL